MSITNFSYTITDLIARIKNESLYIARNVKKQMGQKSSTGRNTYQGDSVDGDDQLDDFGIVENDEPMVKQYMKTGAAIAFDNWLSPLSRTLTEDEIATYGPPYEFEGINNPLLIVYTIKTPESTSKRGYFDINTLPAIDRAVEDYIVYYTLHQWFKFSNLVSYTPNLLALVESQFNDAMNKLAGLMTRRIDLKQTYKWF
jgi:hypothetical protein